MRGVFIIYQASPGSPLARTSSTDCALATLITFSFKFRRIRLGVQGQRQGKNSEKVNYGKQGSESKLETVPEQFWSQPLKANLLSIYTIMNNNSIYNLYC